MHRTVFTTPVINSLLRLACVGFLKLTGWKIEGHLPSSAAKSVLIAAPHTSNWDLPYALMVAFSLRLNIYWLGKHSLFAAPFGPVMRWLGGIAVDRSQANNLVATIAKIIADADGPLQLIVPPEGTRSKTRYWKTGFYYIAQTAQVPIAPVYLDYSAKRGGMGPVFHTTGNIDADMVVIKAFYANIKGKNAHQFDSDA